MSSRVGYRLSENLRTGAIFGGRGPLEGAKSGRVNVPKPLTKGLGDGENGYLGCIQRPGDHFRSHPVGSSHQGLPLRDVFADLSTESKIREFHLGLG